MPSFSLGGRRGFVELLEGSQDRVPLGGCSHEAIAARRLDPLPPQVRANRQIDLWSEGGGLEDLVIMTATG